MLGAFQSYIASSVPVLAIERIFYQLLGVSIVIIHHRGDNLQVSESGSIDGSLPIVYTYIAILATSMPAYGSRTTLIAASAYHALVEPALLIAFCIAHDEACSVIVSGGKVGCSASVARLDEVPAYDEVIGRIGCSEAFVLIHYYRHLRSSLAIAPVSEFQHCIGRSRQSHLGAFLIHEFTVDDSRSRIERNHIVIGTAFHLDVESIGADLLEVGSQSVIADDGVFDFVFLGNLIAVFISPILEIITEFCFSHEGYFIIFHILIRLRIDGRLTAYGRRSDNIESVFVYVCDSSAYSTVDSHLAEETLLFASHADGSSEIETICSGKCSLLVSSKGDFILIYRCLVVILAGS